MHSPSDSRSSHTPRLLVRFVKNETDRGNGLNMSSTALPQERAQSISTNPALARTALIGPPRHGRPFQGSRAQHLNPNPDAMSYAPVDMWSVVLPH